MNLVEHEFRHRVFGGQVPEEGDQVHDAVRLEVEAQDIMAIIYQCALEFEAFPGSESGIQIDPVRQRHQQQTAALFAGYLMKSKEEGIELSAGQARARGG